MKSKKAQTQPQEAPVQLNANAIPLDTKLKVYFKNPNMPSMILMVAECTSQYTTPNGTEMCDLFIHYANGTHDLWKVRRDNVKHFETL